MVVIVDSNEVAQLQVTSHGGSLTGNTLHGTAITEEGVSVVVKKIIAGLVEDTSRVSLGNGQTDGVRETLTKRSSGDLNTGGVVGLGVTGSDAVELLGESAGTFHLEINRAYTEGLEVIQGQLVAEEVQQSVLQHAAVAVPIRSSSVWTISSETGSRQGTYERTKRSRLTQSGFLGLKFMNLLNRTWATGAMPIGAPGWPEFALEVAST